MSARPGEHAPAARAAGRAASRTVRVLTGARTRTPGPRDGLAPRDPHRRQSRSSGACYEP